MTDQEILTKAIEKAALNGWKPKYMEVRYIPIEGIFNIVFSHSFAKAFWGEEPKVGVQFDVDGKWESFGTIPYYKYQLQRLVLEENPIQYLEKFL